METINTRKLFKGNDMYKKVNMYMIVSLLFILLITTKTSSHVYAASISPKVTKHTQKEIRDKVKQYGMDKLLNTNYISKPTDREPYAI